MRGEKTQAGNGKEAFERKKAWECSGQVNEVDSSWGRAAADWQGKGRGRWEVVQGQVGALLPQVSLALHRPSGCLSNSLGLIESPAPLFHKQIRELRRTGRLLWGLVLVVPGKAVCSWSWSSRSIE